MCPCALRTWRITRCSWKHGETHACTGETHTHTCRLTSGNSPYCVAPALRRTCLMHARATPKKCLAWGCPLSTKRARCRGGRMRSRSWCTTYPGRPTPHLWTYRTCCCDVQRGCQHAMSPRWHKSGAPSCGRTGSRCDIVTQSLPPCAELTPAVVLPAARVAGPLPGWHVAV